MKFDDKPHRNEEASLFFTDEVFELFAVVVIPQPVVARLQLQAVLVSVLHPIVRLPWAPVREALRANHTPCLGPSPLPLLKEVTTPNPEPGRVKVG